MDKTSETVVLYVMVAIIALLVCKMCIEPMSASADGLWTPKAQVLLKRCLIAEADGYPADRAPIAYVLQRRATMRGWPLARMIRAYCQYSKAWRPRARAVLRLPKIGDVKYRRWKRVWQELDSWTSDFIAGRIPDPCPLAIHWSGETDPKPAPSLAVVNCGPTKNTFYRRRVSERDVLSVAIETVNAIDRLRGVLRKEVLR